MSPELFILGVLVMVVVGNLWVMYKEYLWNVLKNG